jgi:carbon-monoxide dehydrogenase medium subunit
MQSFDYLEPTTLEETVRSRAASGDDGVILAGGQTLLIMMRMRLSSPSTVIALRGVGELRRIDELDDGSVRIGAMATYRSIGRGVVAARLPLLARAATSVGSIHIRELGTIGGAVAHADPAADVPAALLALDATYDIAAIDGSRSVPAAQFVTGLLQTRLGSDGVLASIVVPAQPPQAAFGYSRFLMREGEYPMTQAAVRVVVEAGAIASARVVVGGGGDRTRRLEAVEEWLVGVRSDADVGTEVKSRVEALVEPYSDARGSATWKAEVAGVMARRALGEALAAA